MSAKALCHWALGLAGVVGTAFLVSPATAIGPDSSGSIGDLVWHDLDADGTQDAGEPGIPGVELTLLPSDSGGAGIFNASTDDEGRYFFDNLPTNASYRVSVDPQNFAQGGALEGLAPTLSFVGDPTLDSNGGNPVITLSSTGITATLDLDFGFGACNTCDGGATALSIKYVGALNGAQVQASAGAILASQVMNPGDIINVAGLGGGTIGNLLTMSVNGQTNAVIDTSCICCSTPLPAYNPNNGANSTMVAGVLQQLGASVAPGTGYDLNGNGRVDIGDLNLLFDGQPQGTPGFEAPAVQDTVLFEEKFEGPVVGWGTSGLWHVTPGCRRDPVCDGNQWAYFGSDNGCNYATGTPRERGFLTSPAITLPEASGCGALKLSFCHFYQPTNSTLNKARVLCNGQLIDTVTAQSPLKWRTRTLDLTAFAGQTVRLQWEFDTSATTLHRKLGWQVDNIQVTRSEGGSLCIGSGIRVGDFEVFSGRSAAGLLCEHSICCDENTDPSGACCLPDGTCQVFPSGPECIAASGAFYGAGTTCEDANCQSRLGACCTRQYDSTGASVSVCAQTTLATCISTGGSFLGIGIPCSNTACTFAACCIEDIGLCTIVPPSTCASFGGTAGPLNSDCGDIQCIPKGACCLYNGQCVQKTRIDCHSSYGIYQGDYTRCANVTCPPVGACCYAQNGSGNSNGAGGGSCIVVAEWYCNGVLHGRYQGNGSVCTEQTCTPTGACCVVLGHCVPNTSAEQCHILLGIWRGAASSCSNARCDDRGACCLNPGGCVPLTTEAACVRVLKGTWAGKNVNCGNAGCTPIGACCYPDGDCDLTTRVLCANEDGIYRGDNTLCITAGCTRVRACCLPNGGCEMATEAECVNVLGGTWRSNKFTCASAGCTPPPTGRCCVPANGSGTYTCNENVTQVACQNQMGLWGGAGSSCTSNQCPVPTGRCCLPATGPGTGGAPCQNNVTEGDCVQQQGSWGGAGSSCASNSCPAPATGACCFASSGICTVVSSDACSSQNGAYLGDNTTCDNCPCTPNTPGNDGRGACCFVAGGSGMAQCVETDDSGCNQRYGTFYPDKCCEDIECDADDYGRCCIFDASLSGTECVTTTQSICTSLGGDWGGGGTNCTGGNPCDPD